MGIVSFNHIYQLHCMRWLMKEPLYRHIEGVSTVFGTVLNYVMLRILGVSDKEPMMKRARSTILNHGNVLIVPQRPRQTCFVNLNFCFGVQEAQQLFHRGESSGYRS